jgi:hypothetical protein
MGYIHIVDQSAMRIHPFGIGPERICPNGICPKRICPKGICAKRICPERICPNGIGPNGIGPKRICPNGICPQSGSINLCSRRVYKYTVLLSAEKHVESIALPLRRKCSIKHQLSVLHTHAAKSHGY